MDTEPGPLGAFWSLLEGAHTAINIISLGRDLGVSGVLFKAGLLVGAAASMLLAPLPGAELRRALLVRLGLSSMASHISRRTPKM